MSRGKPLRTGVSSLRGPQPGCALLYLLSLRHETVETHTMLAYAIHAKTRPHLKTHAASET